MTILHQSLGRYLIEAEIGRGAMGIVYRAYDPHIGRTVAIKTISLSGPEFAEDESYRARFLREARAAGRLSHPGIVTIFDVGEDSESGEPYLVMEHISGEPLSKLLGRSRKLPVPQALQFAQEIAIALDYAHNQGVVHRDVKPPNILIAENGRAKIADFGVAWLNREVSQTGEIVGSPAYMAPEQMAGKPADARSDLFSLGVVLYTMLTGFRPFQGNSAKTVVFKVRNIEPVPVTTFQSDIPPELDAIVSRAIAKDPDERFSSGAEFARAIQCFRETDFVFDEATEFFARAVQGDSKPQQWPFPASATRYLPFAAACIGVVLASLSFAWRMSKLHHLPPAPKVVTQTQLQPVGTQPPTIAKLAAPITQPAPHHLGLRNLGSRKLGSRQTKPRLTSIAAVTTTPVAVIQPVNMQVEIAHHFDKAKASVWLDDKLVLDQDLHGPDEKHLLRSVEVEQVMNVQLAAGKHWLQVRVVSPESKYDQIETFATDLKGGSEHVLSVRCEKRKLQVAFQ